jgi:hypothetical protein
MSEEHLLVRQRPALVGRESCYVCPAAGGIVRISGNAWHRVPRDVGEQLRTIGMHDLPGHRHGEASFLCRFDVIHADQFAALVKAEQAKIDVEARLAAQRAAEAAIASCLESAPVTLAEQAIVEPPIDPVPAVEPPKGDKGEAPKPEPVELAVPIDGPVAAEHAEHAP